MMNSKRLTKYAIGIGSLAISGTLLPISGNAQNPKNANNHLKRPNILFIAVDDLRPVISVYGDKMAHTPNFDRLARYSVTFTSNYCQMALSGPTRASLLTGLRPDHIGVWSLQGNFRINNPQAITLPEILKINGYETVGIGKIFHPLDNKKFRDDPQSWSLPYIKTPSPTYLIAGGRKATECADVPDNAYEDGIIAERGIEQLKSLSKSEKPFFLAVGFKKPHAPYVAPKKYWDMYDRDKMPIAEYQGMSSDPVLYAYHPSNELKVYSDIPHFHSYEDTKHLDEATQRRVIHAYYACVSYIDAQLGKILDELEGLGLANNTIIVLWSDHGYHLGDHGLWNKTTNFETSTRTILMICAPGMKRDVFSNSISEFVDVYPTVCDLAGVDAPENLDGKSLAPALKNPSIKINEYAYGQYNRGNINGYSCRNSKYRMVEWIKDFRTYVPFEGKEMVGIELYDYEKDPLETKNVAKDPHYRKVFDKMQKDLHSYYQQHFEKSKKYRIAELFPMNQKARDDEEE